MAGVAPAPYRFQFFDNSGNPLNGGKVDVYLAGTTTRTNTWSDRAQTTLNANPIVLDSAGRASIVLDTAKTYKFVVKTSAGVTLYTDDNIVGAAGVALLADALSDIEAARVAAITDVEEQGTTSVTAVQTAQSTAETALEELVTQAEAAEAAAEAASATSGAYPNSASNNVPRGLTQASVGTITAGSGGTNGTFSLGWSGGNFTHNPTGTFTVSGGQLTAVTITGPGLYIGSSPTVPTPSFTASSGLTGAAVVLTAQFLVTAGQGYWVASSDSTRLQRYKNVAGAATRDVTVPDLLTADGALAVHPSDKDTQLWDYATDAGMTTGVKFTFFTSATTADANGRISGFIAVEPSTAYRLIGYRDTSNIYQGFYDASQNPINGVNNQAASGSITTPANCYYMKLGLSATATQAGFGDDQYKRIVFLKASVAPNYKPYQSPYPYYEAVDGETDIDGYLLESNLMRGIAKRHGKNLFNYQEAQTNLFIDASGVLTFTSNAFAQCSPFIPVDGGEAYTLSGNVSQPNGWAFYDEDYALCAGGSGVAYAFTAFGTNRTAPATARYVRFQLTAFNAASDLSANFRNVLFERSATVTTFEEYTETARFAVESDDITTTVLTGTKIAGFGDSMTEEDNSWFVQLVGRTGALNTSDKNAVGGRTIGQFLQPEAGETSGDVLAKYVDADYIFIMGGANHRGGSLGSVGDATQNASGTMVQQLNYLVAQIEANNATAPIIFLVPPTGTTHTASALATLESAYQMLIDWCDNRGYIWLPIWHDFPRSHIVPSPRWYRSSVTSTATTLIGDGTHPTTRAGGGHTVIVDILLDHLLALEENGML